MVAQLEKHNGAVSGAAPAAAWIELRSRGSDGVSIAFGRSLDWSLASSHRIGSLQGVTRGTFASGISKTPASQTSSRH